MYLRLIKEMHAKFNINDGQVVFTEREKKFRIAALREEIDEYEEAEVLEDELDALVDLSVFLFGTVERMGFADVFDEAYLRVMESNMQKILGPNNKRGSFSLDLQKPADFTPVNLSDLVGE